VEVIPGGLEIKPRFSVFCFFPVLAAVTTQKEKIIKIEE